MYGALAIMPCCVCRYWKKIPAQAPGFWMWVLAAGIYVVALLLIALAVTALYRWGPSRPRAGMRWIAPGTIDEIGEDHVVVDVHGVCYVAYCSARTLSRLGSAGEAVVLFIETRLEFENDCYLFSIKYRCK